MYVQLRYLYTSVRLHSQLGRIVNKVLNFNQPKKTKTKNSTFNRTPTLPTAFVNPKQTHKNRRVIALNKIFMKYITDLMATGEVAPGLLGKGIEVTHVQVLPDFSGINVYWVADNDLDVHLTIENVLKVSAGHLQHELSKLRVIGNVPPINFVRNKQYNAAKVVDEKLAKVDFGEDYNPLEYIPCRIPSLKMKLSDKVKKQLVQMNTNVDTEIQEENDVFEILIPEMRQNVMGFDHDFTMSRLNVNLNKAKIEKKSQMISLVERQQTTDEEINNFMSSKENKVFDEFLKKRLIAEKRKKKTIPLREAKLQSETEWNRVMQQDYIDDLPIEDSKP